jgi:MFS family permease
MNKNLTIFTVYVTFMNLGILISSPFYTVYMLKDMRIGYEFFAITVVVGALAKALTHSHWGNLSDRFGSRKILVICGVLGSFVPLGWMFVTSAWQILILKIYDGFIFSGFELVVFNFVLDLTPAKNSPKYIAAHNFSAGMGEVFGCVAGGFLAHVFENSQFLWLFGLQVVFFASFIVRALSLLVLPMIKDINIRQGEIAPVRYVFWQAVAVEPVRGIKNVLSFTFRYPSNVEKELRNGVKKLRYKIKMQRV